MEGVLISVEGEVVQIDSKYYRAAKPQFVPKQRNVVVSFSTSKEDPQLITFIKVKETTTEAPAAQPATAPQIKGETAPATTGAAQTASPAAKPPFKKWEPKAPNPNGYGSKEDVRGKEVGCAIGAASVLLAGRGKPISEILKEMDEVVAGILAISAKYKAQK